MTPSMQRRSVTTNSENAHKHLHIMPAANHTTATVTSRTALRQPLSGWVSPLFVVTRTGSSSAMRGSLDAIYSLVRYSASLSKRANKKRVNARTRPMNWMSSWTDIYSSRSTTMVS